MNLGTPQVNVLAMMKVCTILIQLNIIQIFTVHDRILIKDIEPRPWAYYFPKSEAQEKMVGQKLLQLMASVIYHYHLSLFFSQGNVH